MTGTPEAGSYSNALLQNGSMELLCDPVHQNEAEYHALLHKIRFSEQFHIIRRIFRQSRRSESNQRNEVQ